MNNLQWQDASTPTETLSVSNPLAVSVSNPWLGISMGLLGLIIGFALHRFIVPMTLGASASAQRATTVTQGIVVQPSAMPPPAAPVGGGCGCGGAGGACGAAAVNPPQVPRT